jgi:GT2 family glycosyltransferase
MALVAHYPALNRPDGPLVSVCIAHYRGPELIAACLDSVLEQQCDFRFEIIVHDDASPDDSVAFLREKYPQVELLASRENVGFCVANNRMVAHARGDYVLLLNNDAALLADALAALALAATRQTSPGILTLPQYDWESGDLVDRGCMLDPFYNPVPNLDPERSEVAMVIGACLWIPRSTWEQLGGFPEWFESIGEDLYLCCLSRLCGLDVRATPTSGYRHRQGASFGGNRATKQGLATTYRRRYLSERNKTYVLILMQPPILLLPALLVHIVLLLLEGLALSLFSCNLRPITQIYWRAIVAVASNKKLLAAHRHSVQKKRASQWRDYLKGFTWVPRKLQLAAKYGLPRIASN